MIPREAAPALLALAGHYPVVVVTGPRQSGKTTLARHLFAHKPYASLEDLDLREAAMADPRGFLAQFPDGAVLDEVQRAPGLFSYLQGVVDADGRTGLFVLTGSQQFGMLASVTQSLAGRAGLLHLLPLSLREVSAHEGPQPLWPLLAKGFYPPVHTRDIPPDQWFPDYVSSYIERDVRQLIGVRDLSAFQQFTRMCALRTAQMVNLSALAADCGITHNTAKAWLSVLEASYVVFRVPPFHRNLGKRLTKTPKLYFYDTGLAAWLAGVRNPEQARLGPMRGPMFETFVVSEFVKHRNNGRLAPELHYWRDGSGNEIDLVVEDGPSLNAVEIKSGETMAGDWLAPLHRFGRAAGTERLALVYGGPASYERDGVAVRGWQALDGLMEATLGKVARQTTPAK